MSSVQIAAPNWRMPHRVVAGIVATAFALGALTGFGLPRILAGTSAVTGATGAVLAPISFTGVPTNNMTDAVRRALLGH